MGGIVGARVGGVVGCIVDSGRLVGISVAFPSWGGILEDGASVPTVELVGARVPFEVVAGATVCVITEMLGVVVPVATVAMTVGGVVVAFDTVGLVVVVVDPETIPPALATKIAASVDSQRVASVSSCAIEAVWAGLAPKMSIRSPSATLLK